MDLFPSFYQRPRIQKNLVVAFNRNIKGPLKVCSLSLFRPYKRNLRFRAYYDGLKNFVDDFPNIFTDWIIRIYVDDSLFTSDYIYENDEKPEWVEEDEWPRLLRELHKIEYVQLAYYSASEFRKDKNYHKGYFGTIARFFTLFDPEVSVSIFRDIDSNAIVPDKLSIDKWIEDDRYLMHAYKWPYEAKHLSCVGVSSFDFYGAGMTACKQLNSEKIEDLWRHITNTLYSSKVEECVPNLSYGVDEIVLNTTIKNFFGENNIYEQDVYSIAYPNGTLTCDKRDKVSELAIKNGYPYESLDKRDQKSIGIYANAYYETCYKGEPKVIWEHMHGGREKKNENIIKEKPATEYPRTASRTKQDGGTLKRIEKIKKWYAEHKQDGQSPINFDNLDFSQSLQILLATRRTGLSDEEKLNKIREILTTQQIKTLICANCASANPLWQCECHSIPYCNSSCFDKHHTY